MLSEVLTDNRISRLVELALLEDIGLGDVTSDATVEEGLLATGVITTKSPGVVAGLDVAALVFQFCDHSITLQPIPVEGEYVEAGTILARVDGAARGILRGERTALNFLQRMSGIATLTSRYVKAVEGTTARICDTRKTAPGLRVLDKWAVRAGGGTNHRFGLDDMVLIKDNHIVAAGGIQPAVNRCKEYLGSRHINCQIEVETKNLDEVREALSCNGIHRIMLDNFSTTEMRNAVELVGRRVDVEASGGITLANVREVAATGVDYISVGALTHSVSALDISLDLTQTSS